MTSEIPTTYGPTSQLPNCILADTNWILDLIFDQDPESRLLLDTAAGGSFRVVVSSVSVGEAMKVVERRKSDYAGSAQTMDRTAKLLGRTPEFAEMAAQIDRSAVALSSVSDRYIANLWKVLDEVVRSVAIAELTPAVIDEATELSAAFGLSVVDAIIVGVALSGECSHLLTKDRFPRSSAVVPYLKQRGISVYHTPRAVLDSLTP